MKRRALFVGVNKYEDDQIRDLECSLSDAHALKTMFELFDYQSDILENPSKSEVFRAVRQMTADLSAGDLFFFYFAGHGWTTTAGKHLLFCADDQYEDLRYDYNVGIPFDILKKRTESGGYNRAFVLDACRSDFITGTRGDDATTRDLRPIGELVRDAPSRSSLAVLRSCSQYEHALEVKARKHGLFTLAMMDVLRASREGGMELLFGESLCDAVTDKMRCIAREEGITAEQTPEFAKSGAAQVLVEGRRGRVPPALVVCPVCGKKNDPRDTFKCQRCGRDNLCLRHQDGKTFLCADCTEKKALHRTGDVKTLVLPGGAKMEMIYCAPGEFMMGSPKSEEGRYENEDLHSVELTKGFWLGKYPVTQGQWQSVMGENPSHFSGDARLPVETVSWDDCKEFVERVMQSVREQMGGEARFPTEAEWEYACRAGTATAYSWGNALNGDRANCDGCHPCGMTRVGPYLEKTTPVGRYGANAWGFADMHGNVWEWCADWCGAYCGDAVDPAGPASGAYRVLRGGGWSNFARSCRSAYRSGRGPGCRDHYYGFRLCCSAGPRGKGAEQ